MFAMGGAWAQQGAQAGNHQLAGLQQDVAAMQREMGQARLELEVLRRENARLLQLVQAVGQNGAKDFEAQLQALKQQFQASQAELKQQILAEVTAQLDKLGTQMQKAAQEPAQSGADFKFTDDYPKEGIAYTVKAGDTLSKIAQANRSTIRDIQNANRISDPKSIRVGQTLFVPQKS